MLLRFKVSNCRSLREEQELSLVAAPLQDGQSSVVQIGTDLSVLRTAAIYGANASGKSNVLKALEFVGRAVRHSHRLWDAAKGVPRQPFLLDGVSAAQPSRFVLTLLANDVIFEYGFAVDSNEVLEEWLDAWPRSRRQRWFHRSGQSFRFGTLMPGENRAIARLTRPNSLFLSAAAQNNHRATAGVYDRIAERLTFASPGNADAQQIFTTHLCENEDTRQRVARLLVAADIGVTGLDVVDDDRVLELLSQVGESRLRDNPAVNAAVRTVRLQHRASEDGASVPLPLSAESAGTVAYFRLLGPALDALSRGAVLCVDELDASLHPLLCSEILQAFSDADTNPQNAQLIFTSHDTGLLSSGLLRRDQVWLTEKNDEGGTQLYSLHTYKPRKEENLERGYLQGRYGGVPYVEGLHRAMGRQ